MTVPSSYNAAASNLQQVQHDPSIPLDTSLLDKLKMELGEDTDRTLAATLLVQISQLLPILQEDPTPVTTLGIRAAEYFTFTDLRSVNPPIDFVAGFQAPSPSINLLALSLLAKAGETPGDAAVVAGDSGLVASLVKLWLSTSSTEVAQAAFDTIWSLLEIDLAQESPEGQGLVWRRLFTDKNVYGIFFSLCSLSEDGPLSKRQKSIAQGRLMDFIVEAGRRRWDMISHSQIAEIEDKYRCNSLLHFAACRMVDTNDVLMHMTLLNFFREILEIDAPGLVTRSYVQSSSTVSSPALDFLISEDLHSQVLGYYLDESKLDPIDLTFLANSVMAYVAQYARLYPNHLLQSPKSVLDGILSHVAGSLAISSAQWAHGPVPSGHLLILSSLPRVLLVKVSGQSSDPLLALPTSPPSKEALDTLGRIFHGPPKIEIPTSMELGTSGNTPTDWHREAAAARILYFTYLNTNATLWADVVYAADVLAMKEVALTALSFMKAVITANWQTLSPEVTRSASQYQLPSEDQLGWLSPASQGTLPSSGVWAVLTPPALTTLLPFLFKPPRSYAEFAGGGAGDAESVVWKVATAKYEVLVALYNRLKDSGAQESGFEDIMRTLRQRVTEGPWGPVAQAARVETIGL
ncbi:hypothetical protein MPDQ_000687 [Monascus purpureus]|uniref:DNA mismatch repair protein HSM3 N-terminal domain-containing protein n=1 Tax=Monascus purpureus TaxID=5098 RepID=A0A507QP78_MONPU|nr:hypothetical protein MPDQ_000687 [Monascus purpureus]BDD62119.1 hypothetical protein MAP00_007110 [Monascus purpureus]